ncbi:MAG: hypothetical protein V2A59_01800 [Candidatus Omnitrophota bacterium]
MRAIFFALSVLILTTSLAFAQNTTIICDETKYRDIGPGRVETIGFTKGLALGSIKEFVVYLDKNNKENHYAASGWMGDFGDIKIDEQFTQGPHSGSTCIQFTYSVKKTKGQGWAGVTWQNPANNWGSKIGGFDLSAMNKATFWAKGLKGGEVIQKFMIGGVRGAYSDSVTVEIGPVELTNDWKQYTINLVGKDRSYISGGFGWMTSADLNPQGCTFYLDDIKFEADPNLKAEGRVPQEMPFYVYADRGAPMNHFVASGWMGDYGDIKYDGASTDNPYSGSTCIKITYCACAYQGARWAGMNWQNPANNWGDIDAGFDLSKATKLTFWARGAKGGERLQEFKVGGISGAYADSDNPGIAGVVLNKEWTQYTIDLKGRDMSYIIGGFCWVAKIDDNPEAFDMYLDEIKFE